MQTIQEIIGWLVASSAFVVWALFLPQIRLLYRVKKAESISLVTVVGSFTIQTLVFTHALLGKDYKLAFLQSTSMFFLAVVITMIIYYRCVPGGWKSDS